MDEKRNQTTMIPTNDTKVFKLGIGNDLGTYLKLT